MKIKLLFAALVGWVSPLLAQQDATVTCFNTVAEDPRLESIRGKLALGNAKGITFTMLADDSKPNSEQKAAIAIWATSRGDCMVMNQAIRDRVLPPQISVLATEGEGRMMLDAVDLFQDGQHSENSAGVGRSWRMKWLVGGRSLPSKCDRNRKHATPSRSRR